MRHVIVMMEFLFQNSFLVFLQNSKQMSDPGAALQAGRRVTTGGESGSGL